MSKPPPTNSFTPPMDCRFARTCVYLSAKGLGLRTPLSNEVRRLKVEVELKNLMSSSTVVPCLNQPQFQQILDAFEALKVCAPLNFSITCSVFSPLVWLKLSTLERSTHQLATATCVSCYRYNSQAYNMSSSGISTSSAAALSSTAGQLDGEKIKNDLLSQISQILKPVDIENNVTNDDTGSMMDALNCLPSNTLDKLLSVLKPGKQCPDGRENASLHQQQNPAKVNLAKSPKLNAPPEPLAPTKSLNYFSGVEDINPKHVTKTSTTIKNSTSMNSSSPSFVEITAAPSPKSSCEIRLPDLNYIPPGGMWIVRCCKALFEIQIGTVLNTNQLADSFMRGANVVPSPSKISKLALILGLETKNVERQYILSGYRMFNNNYSVNFDKSFANQIARVTIHQLFDGGGCPDFQLAALNDAISDVIMQAYQIHRNTPPMTVAKVIMVQGSNSNVALQCLDGSGSSGIKDTSPPKVGPSRKRRKLQSHDVTMNSHSKYNFTNSPSQYANVANSVPADFLKGLISPGSASSVIVSPKSLSNKSTMDNLERFSVIKSPSPSNNKIQNNTVLVNSASPLVSSVDTTSVKHSLEDPSHAMLSGNTPGDSLEQLVLNLSEETLNRLVSDRKLSYEKLAELVGTVADRLWNKDTATTRSTSSAASNIDPSSKCDNISPFASACNTPASLVPIKTEPPSTPSSTTTTSVNAAPAVLSQPLLPPRAASSVNVKSYMSDLVSSVEEDPKLLEKTSYLPVYQTAASVSQEVGVAVRRVEMLCLSDLTDTMLKTTCLLGILDHLTSPTCENLAPHQKRVDAWSQMVVSKSRRFVCQLLTSLTLPRLIVEYFDLENRPDLKLTSLNNYYSVVESQSRAQNENCTFNGKVTGETETNASAKEQVCENRLTDGKATTWSKQSVISRSKKPPPIMYKTQSVTLETSLSDDMQIAKLVHFMVNKVSESCK